MDDIPGGIQESPLTFATTALPGDLLNDAPGDDRTDHALKARYQSFEEADALAWLLDGTDASAQPDTERDAHGARTGSPAGTIVRGFAELPRQAVGGVRDAAQNILDFSDWLGQAAEQRLPIGGVQIFDKEGNISFDYIPPATLKAGRDAGTIETPDLPDVGQPQTTAGAIIRPITQFMAPYVR
jgi:hypothetical protein